MWFRVPARGEFLRLFRILPLTPGVRYAIILSRSTVMMYPLFHRLQQVWLHLISKFFIFRLYESANIPCSGGMREGEERSRSRSPTRESRRGSGVVCLPDYRAREWEDRGVQQTQATQTLAKDSSTSKRLHVRECSQMVRVHSHLECVFYFDSFFPVKSRIPGANPISS